MDRVHSLLEEIINTNEIILIVSHAGVGRIIETNKKGLPASTFYDLDPFPNAQVIELIESHLQVGFSLSDDIRQYCS